MLVNALNSTGNLSSKNTRLKRLCICGLSWYARMNAEGGGGGGGVGNHV